MKHFKSVCSFLIGVLIAVTTAQSQNVEPPCPYKQNDSGAMIQGQRSGGSAPYQQWKEIDTGAAEQGQRSGGPAPYQQQNEVSSSPDQPYYIRLYNIDDEATAYVNNQPVKSVGYDGDSEWVDIGRYLKNGSNTVRFVLKNNQGTWSYGFGLSRDQEFIWKDECGRVGSAGCKNNDQTIGVVFEKSVDFLYGEGAPKRTVPPSRSGGNAMYTDTHTGWIGYQPQKNQYAFDVDRYTPGSRWFLSANAFISNCGNTSGSVYMRREGGTNIKIGTWNQQLLPCYPGGDMPGNPDNTGLTLDLHNYALSKQQGVITLDVTQVINSNGRYIIEWRYESGCCPAFVTEMKLRGEW